MWIEVGVWIIVTTLYLLLSQDKRFISKEYGSESKRIDNIRSTKYKSLDEQKEFVALNDTTGKDFISFIYSSLAFLLPFIIIILPKIDNFYVGLGTVLVFALILSWVVSKLLFPKYYDEKFIVNFTIYLYSGLFLLYIKFIELPNSWIVLLITVAYVFSFGWIMNKFFNGGVKWS